MSIKVHQRQSAKQHVTLLHRTPRKLPNMNASDIFGKTWNKFKCGATVLGVRSTWNGSEGCGRWLF